MCLCHGLLNTEAAGQAFSDVCIFVSEPYGPHPCAVVEAGKKEYKEVLADQMLCLTRTLQWPSIYQETKLAMMLPGKSRHVEHRCWMADFRATNLPSKANGKVCFFSHASTATPGMCCSVPAYLGTGIRDLHLGTKGVEEEEENLFPLPALVILLGLLSYGPFFYAAWHRTDWQSAELPVY